MTIFTFSHSSSFLLLLLCLFYSFYLSLQQHSYFHVLLDNATFPDSLTSFKDEIKIGFFVDSELLLLRGGEPDVKSSLVFLFGKFVDEMSVNVWSELDPGFGRHFDSPLALNKLLILLYLHFGWRILFDEGFDGYHGIEWAFEIDHTVGFIYEVILGSKFFKHLLQFTLFQEVYAKEDEGVVWCFYAFQVDGLNSRLKMLLIYSNSLLGAVKLLHPTL